MFCPACRLALDERTLIDPILEGYACGNGHLFYTTVIEQVGVLPAADTIQPPPLSNDIQILKFWLADPLARVRVPNELAVVCRRIVDIADHAHRVAKVDDPFSFCPTCGETLARFDSDDVYLQGLRCINSHEFWWRGRTVHYVEHGVRANLSVELDDESMPALIEYYAGDDELVKPYVHPQLRGVLERFGR